MVNDRLNLKRKMLLIVNPVAGKRMMAKNLADAVSIFNDAGYMVTVITTAANGDAAKFVKAYARDYDIVCCSGGDGTIKEVAQGMIEADIDVPIGYMPSGSTNNFGDFHELSLDVLEAARQIVNGSENKVDVGMIDGEYFVNVADFGAFTWLPYTTPQHLKNKLGFSAYIIDGLKDFSKLQSKYLKFEINGEKIEGDFFFGAVASSSTMAGALNYFGEPAYADDGLFGVVLIKRPSSPFELETTIADLHALNPNTKLLRFFHTAKIEIECSTELEWAVDGEKKVAQGNHTVKMLPGAFTLVK